jgi:formylglycine-generating enzyme required for sulfatase activity/energy-coupling factor transporter ATP-binding protein EcfA2
MPLTDLLSAVEQPYPGLRSFEMSESLLFFGREQHTQELLRRLAGGRFLAIVGSSGSGKSSLVRAGLLPALYRGYLVDSTTHWRIAVMRPGGSPLANLARALAHTDALGPDGSQGRLAALSSSSMGLVEVVRDAKLRNGESVLVVADQFEELFRYRNQAGSDDGGAEATLFVSLLLQAADRFDASIYVVLTMRSDFLGDCTQFPGLAETLSRSQYLIPRLTREQRELAIEQPVRLAGACIAARLVQQVLNDSREVSAGDAGFSRGSAPDPLPIMQHALMRTFGLWKEAGAQGEIDLPDYDSAGGMDSALNQHAELVYSRLDSTGQVWTGKLFRALTTTELGRPTRRPTRLGRLYKIAGAATPSQQAEIAAVLRIFLGHENSLLISSSRNDLDTDAVLDIPHESLIWKWERLQSWVRQEAISAEWYLDLVKDTASFQKGESGLWRDPNLARALQLAKTENWNAEWAAQYHPANEPTFTETQDFLKRSRRAQQRERWLRGTAAALIVAAFAIVLALYVRNKRIQETNRALSLQVEQIGKEKAELESRSRKYQADLDRAEFDLNSKKGFLPPEEQAQKEKEIQGLRDKLNGTQQQVHNLTNQQDQTAKLLKDNADVAALNRTLQDRLNQLQARTDSLNNDRQAALNEASGLQTQLDSANREIARLKSATENPPNAAQGGAVAPSAAAGQGGPEPAKPVVKQITAQAYRADGKPSGKPITVDAPPGSEKGNLIGGAPRAGDTRVNPKDGLTYVWIPPGTFTMGCSPGDGECSSDENPAHEVRITRGFWVGQTEVTQEAYRNVTRKSNPSVFKGAKRPVETISWNDAQSYCQRAGMRLPTEAEWEYAARAGSKQSRYGNLDQIAWHYGNSGSKTHDVAQKTANAWGLYDTLGNVWEWVADWHANEYPLSNQTDPRGPSSGNYRVLRGGSSFLGSRYERVSTRVELDQPGYPNSIIGVRCVGELP